MPPKKKPLGQKPIVVQPPVTVTIDDPANQSVSSKAKPMKKKGAGVQVEAKKEPTLTPEQIKKNEEERRKKEHKEKVEKLLKGLTEQVSLLDK